MDYAKMMFAVEVHKLATTKYLAELAEQRKIAKVGIDVLRWSAQNPVTSFAPAALAELVAVAAIITAET